MRLIITWMLNLYYSATIRRGPMYQRATKLYIDLVHHQPNFDKSEEADQFTLLESALREVVRDCNPWQSNMALRGHKVCGERACGRVPRGLPSTSSETLGNEAEPVISSPRLSERSLSMWMSRS